MTNDTEAPTSAATTENIRPDSILTDEQLDFVTFVEQIYQLHGRLITKADADEFFIPEDEFDKYMSDEFVQAAIAERGIIHRKTVGKDDSTAELAEKRNWKDGALTWLQLLTANAMLNLIDTRSEKKKLQDLGVTNQMYATWMKDPVFQDYLKTRAEGMVAESQHIAATALLDKVRMGDLKAIEYFHEFTDRYTRKSAQGNAAGINSSSADFKMMLNEIVDIIDDEVEDVEAKIRVANRLNALIGKQNLVNGLVNSMEGNAIERPEVMPQRELTPRLQELLDKGEGTH